MKRPAPWYRKQTNSWYACVDGVQRPLGKHPDGPPPRKDKGAWRPPDPILKAFHRLMATEGLATPVAAARVGDLAAEFLVDAAHSCTAKTVEWYRGFLDDFARRHPKLAPEAIVPRLVRAWLHAERKRPWGQNTRRSAVTVLKRLLNWAVENKRLAVNPVADLEREASVRRERVLEPEERARILAWYPEGDPFRDLLVAMTESGCRPGEVMKVRAADVDFEAGTWVLEGKTTRRTGRDRVVYMTATLRALTEALCRRNPEGPIFRNEDGNPWTLQAVNCRFRRKKARKNDRLDGDVSAYVYRGTWATDALEKGVPDAAVAELMGHQGTAILHKNYSKLRERRRHLREMAEKAAAEEK